MFSQIRELLSGAAKRPLPGKLDHLEVAVAALLVHAASMDDLFDASERAAIERLLSERFNLAPAAVLQLLKTAEYVSEWSSQLYPFTRIAVEQLDAAQRIQLIEMLWEVAYADGVLDPDEDALIRRVAGLLYVSDHDRGAARKRVLTRISAQQETAPQQETNEQDV